MSSTTAISEPCDIQSQTDTQRKFSFCLFKACHITRFDENFYMLSLIFNKYFSIIFFLTYSHLFFNY